MFNSKDATDAAGAQNKLNAMVCKSAAKRNSTKPRETKADEAKPKQKLNQTRPKKNALNQKAC